MTVHTAKGLEFPYVFIAAMSENIFPSKKTADAAAMEEERRLAFVAITRAMRGLAFTDSEGKGHDGGSRYPSRFVLDIDKELVHRIVEPDESLIREAGKMISDSNRLLDARSGITELTVGDRVSHSVMGEGSVVGVDAKTGAYIVKFDILPTERKISFRAPLRRV